MLSVLIPLLLSAPAWAAWPDLAAPLQAPPGGGEKDAAVVVGVERYAFVAPVPGASANANDWYAYLTGTLKIPLEKVALLRDNDATVENLREFAAKAAETVEPGGTLWFVYIGHGAPAKSGKDGVLIGVDAQQRANSIYARSLPQQELIKILSEGRQERTLVLLDACFSGRTPEGKPLVEGLQPLIAVQDGALAAQRRVLVMTAARSDQFAGPLPGAQRPAFSYLALGALRGWAAEGKAGQVAARDVVAYVNKVLRTMVKDRSQTAELASGDPAAPLPAAGEKGPDLAEMVVRYGAAAPAAPADFGAGAAAGAALPKINVISVGGSLESLNVEAEERLDEARTVEEDKAALPKARSDAWCRLAEVGGENPYKAEADKACAQWKEYSDAWGRLQSNINPDMEKLSRFLRLKRAKGQKLAALDAFLANYRDAARDWPGVFGAAVENVIGARERLEKTGEAQLVSGIQDMVLVPAGEFWMGSHEADDEKPRHKVLLGDFYIDKFEVRVAQFRDFSQKTGRPIKEQPEWSGDDHPVTNADWGEAKAYCEWAGKRLPTEAEWEKAARGTDGRRFPWGDEDPGAGGLFRMNWGGGRDRALWRRDGFQYTAPVGSFKAGASPYGAMDMSGNAWEWVADWYDENYYKKSPAKNPKGPDSGKARGVRGGAWYYDADACRAPSRGRLVPSGVASGRGFRCALSLGQ
ncbi:MAG TPA: hypothetical protein DCM05_08265 [Elusimicrobia bacterium]|nr:hypothetical protein [Elusimicrobiota bacterium]